MRARAAAILFLPTLLLAQVAQKTPRMPDGKPDLTGVYQGNATVRGTWEQANSGVGVGGTGRDTTAPAPPSASARPPVREPAPYQPWAAKKVLASFNNRGIDDPTTLCLPPGIPRVTSVGLFPIQIIQTPQQVMILYEYMNGSRVIPFMAKHPDDLEPSYLGDSIAHWEGDTLVVDVVSFNDKTWLGPTGSFHSEKLHITERYTRVDKDRINYDVTMVDPEVLTKPWVVHYSWMLREGTRLREYVCAENNLDPARNQELIKQGVKFQRE